MPIRPPAYILSALVMERERLTYAIAQTISHTFSAAQVGCQGRPGEVDRLVYFFLEGLPLIETQFNHILHPWGIHATLSGIFCHQTPKVEAIPAFSQDPGICELGDILFLATYGRRLWSNYAGNALLVQAKEVLGSVDGTRQDHLYTKATDFVYRSPRSLSGAQRSLVEGVNALWYWGFMSGHSPVPPPFWHTEGSRARRIHHYPYHHAFEFCLMDLICGVNGRRVAVLEANDPSFGWSKVVDDLIRTTALSALRRQNAYASRNREILRGEDAVRAVNGLTGDVLPPFLIRSSLKRLLGYFDEEIARAGATLEMGSLEFEEEKFLKMRPANPQEKIPDSGGSPPLGNERLTSNDQDGGGCSFIIVDFSRV
jgi:hypothetical protein